METTTISSVHNENLVEQSRIDALTDPLHKDVLNIKKTNASNQLENINSSHEQPSSPCSSTDSDTSVTSVTSTAKVFSQSRFSSEEIRKPIEEDSKDEVPLEMVMENHPDIKQFMSIAQDALPKTQQTSTKQVLYKSFSLAIRGLLLESQGSKNFMGKVNWCLSYPNLSSFDIFQTDLFVLEEWQNILTVLENTPLVSRSPYYYVTNLQQLFSTDKAVLGHSAQTFLIVPQLIDCLTCNDEVTTRIPFDTFLQFSSTNLNAKLTMKIFSAIEVQPCCSLQYRQFHLTCDAVHQIPHYLRACEPSDMRYSEIQQVVLIFFYLHQNMSIAFIQAVFFSRFSVFMKNPQDWNYQIAPCLQLIESVCNNRNNNNSCAQMSLEETKTWLLAHGILLNLAYPDSTPQTVEGMANSFSLSFHQALCDYFQVRMKLMKLSPNDVLSTYRIFDSKQQEKLLTHCVQQIDKISATPMSTMPAIREKVSLMWNFLEVLQTSLKPADVQIIFADQPERINLLIKLFFHLSSNIAFDPLSFFLVLSISDRKRLLEWYNFQNAV